MINEECTEEKILLPASISATHEEKVKDTIKQYFSKRLSSSNREVSNLIFLIVTVCFIPHERI